MKPKFDIFHYLNMDDEVDDFDRIHASIEKDVIFKGTNLWILVFAIIVASVGSQYEFNCCNYRRHAYFTAYGTNKRNGI